MPLKRKWRIASYNINGINSRLPVLLRWLEDARPEIVLLQELKCTDEAFPAQAIEALGYQAIWKGQPRWNGVAILSRIGEPIPTRSSLPNDPDSAQSRYIEAAIQGVLIGNLYAPNGNPWPGPKFDYKLAWLDALAAHAAALLGSKVPALLMGDFNIIPTDNDVYKPERWAKDALFSPAARERFKALTDSGWIDSIRANRGDERIFTFWPYWRESFARDAGIRIDHALLSPGLRGRLAGAGVDRTPRGWDKTSDHAPIWIELNP
jgi:exodeoxyribonuclease-3